MPTRGLLILIVLLIAPIHSFGQDDGQPKLDTSALLFELATLKGDTVALADLQGKFVVIHFAASW